MKNIFTARIEPLMEPLLDSTSDAIAVIGRGGVIWYWNRPAAELLGFPREQMVGRKLDAVRIFSGCDFLYSPGRPAASGPSNPAAEHRRILNAHRRDGRDISLEARFVPAWSDGGRFILVFMREVGREFQLEGRARVQEAVAGVLAASPGLDEALPEILKSVCRHLPFRLGAFWDGDSRRRSFKCRAMFYHSARGMETFIRRTGELRMGPGEGMLGRIWQARCPEWIEDVRCSPVFLRAREAEESGLVTAIGFPVVVDGKVGGIFEFYSRRRLARDPELLAFVEALSSQLSQFIARKNAEKKLDRPRRPREEKR